MRLIGLTGGIGMGKSTVAAYLSRRGEKLIDTDLLARELVEPGQQALQEIREIFGNAVISAQGELDRKVLAAAVFADVSLRKRLEAILHPRIRTRWREQADQWKRTGADRAIVVIPLLYETGAETELDRVICVACSPRQQQQRLQARGWSEAEIQARNAAQWPAEKKMDRADGVIWNESSIEICEEQCGRLFENQ